jgi:hypothetical protein
MIQPDMGLEPAPCYGWVQQAKEAIHSHQACGRALEDEENGLTQRRRGAERFPPRRQDSGRPQPSATATNPAQSIVTSTQDYRRLRTIL